MLQHSPAARLYAPSGPVFSRMVFAGGTANFAHGFLHGCPDEEKALAILASSELRPREMERQDRAFLAPVKGRTYLTPDLDYVMSYILGGDMAGCDPSGAEMLIQRHGRYGYLYQAALDLDDAIENSQPDEDFVGRAYCHALDIAKGKDVGFYKDDLFARNLFAPESRGIATSIRLHGDQFLTPLQRRNAALGFMAHQAAAGKRMLKTMPRTIQVSLMMLGAAIAHDGPVPVARAWRFDRKLIPNLAKDGSNLFELAEELELPDPAPDQHLDAGPASSPGP